MESQPVFSVARQFYSEDRELGAAADQSLNRYSLVKHTIYRVMSESDNGR